MSLISTYKVKQLFGYPIIIKGEDELKDYLVNKTHFKHQEIINILDELNVGFRYDKEITIIKNKFDINEVAQNFAGADIKIIDVTFNQSTFLGDTGVNYKVEYTNGYTDIVSEKDIFHNEHYKDKIIVDKNDDVVLECGRGNPKCEIVEAYVGISAHSEKYFYCRTHKKEVN